MESLNIIIADNYPILRLGMEAMIKKTNTGSQIFQASNGNEILEIIKSISIDLIFMDVRMPGMDGIKATSVLKKIFPGIKIIALSTTHEKYDVLNMVKAGADGYLLKNASLEKIESALQVIFSGGNYFSDEIKCLFSGKFLEKGKKKLSKSLKEELSQREKEVLILICEQLSTKEISQRMGLSEKTIEIYRSHIIAKTHSKNMIGLVLYAIENRFCNYVDLQTANRIY